MLGEARELACSAHTAFVSRHFSNIMSVGLCDPVPGIVMVLQCLPDAVLASET